MKFLSGLLEWLPALGILFVVVFGVAYCTQVEEEEPTPVEITNPIIPPFNPITLVGLTVSPDVIAVGQEATLLNGICNNTDHPVIAEVYLAVQRKSPDPALGAEVVVFIQRDPGQGAGRGKAMPIDPGCTAQQPIKSPVPQTVTAGEWRAFLEVVVQGENGQEQREAEFSNYFTVVAP